MEEMRVDLQEQLGVLLKDEWVAISSDGWTSRSRDTYLGVTYHFIDSDWVLLSVTVDCEKLVGSTIIMNPCRVRGTHKPLQGS